MPVLGRTIGSKTKKKWKIIGVCMAEFCVCFGISAHKILSCEVSHIHDNMVENLRRILGKSFWSRCVTFTFTVLLTVI